jgi:hypothetical protein
MVSNRPFGCFTIIKNANTYDEKDSDDDDDDGVRP